MDNEVFSRSETQEFGGQNEALGDQSGKDIREEQVRDSENRKLGGVAIRAVLEGSATEIVEGGMAELKKNPAEGYEAIRAAREKFLEKLK